MGLYLLHLSSLEAWNLIDWLLHQLLASKTDVWVTPHYPRPPQFLCGNCGCCWPCQGHSTMWMHSMVLRLALSEDLIFILDISYKNEKLSGVLTIIFYSSSLCSGPLHSSSLCSDPLCSGSFCSDPLHSSVLCSDPLHSSALCSDPLHSSALCSSPLCISLLCSISICSLFIGTLRELGPHHSQYTTSMVYQRLHRKASSIAEYLAANGIVLT